jgi:hypothetical protein
MTRIKLIAADLTESALIRSICVIRVLWRF